MQFRISKYKIKKFCCTDNFYIFSVKYHNRVYDIAFEFNETNELEIENSRLNITILRIKDRSIFEPFEDNIKINIVYNNISYNFILIEEDINKWIDITMFY